MLPDIDLRLANTIKALRELIIPALPPDQGLAREQAELALAHLGVIAEQWKHALRFQLTSYRALHALGIRLGRHASDAVLRNELTAALGAADSLDCTDYDAVSNATRALGALIDRVIDADGSTAPLDRDLLDAVLAHGQAQALRDRAWSACCGLDPDRDSLPKIGTLLDSIESV